MLSFLNLESSEERCICIIHFRHLILQVGKDVAGEVSVEVGDCKVFQVFIIPFEFSTLKLCSYEHGPIQITLKDPIGNKV